MTYRRDTKGAYCGWVGARTSPRFGRVYDKGIEQKSHAPGYRWRIEMEYKQQQALRAWTRLTESMDAPKWAYSECESSWRWSQSSWLLPKGECVDVYAAPKEKLPPSVERSLKWLREQVSPTLLRLLPIVGTETLLRAMELDGYAEPIRGASE